MTKTLRRADWRIRRVTSSPPSASVKLSTMAGPPSCSDARTTPTHPLDRAAIRQKPRENLTRAEPGL